MNINIKISSDYPENSRGEKMYDIFMRGNSFTQVMSLSESELNNMAAVIVNFILDSRKEETKNASTNP